ELGEVVLGVGLDEGDQRVGRAEHDEMPGLAEEERNLLDRFLTVLLVLFVHLVGEIGLVGLLDLFVFVLVGLRLGGGVLVFLILLGGLAPPATAAGGGLAGAGLVGPLAGDALAARRLFLLGLFVLELLGEGRLEFVVVEDHPAVARQLHVGR